MNTHDGLGFERHCTEIVAQTTLLTRYLEGADLGAPVPTCPGWNVSQLMRHVDGGLRWAAEIVESLATAPPPDDAFRDLSGFAAEDPRQLHDSLTDAAEQLTRALAGPIAQMWCPLAGGGSAFYARRFAHETAVHRADAAIALGVDYLLDAEIAGDAIDEWLELGCLPFHFDVNPRMRELLGPDRRIGLHATDTGADWLIDFTADLITWRSGTHGPPPSRCGHRSRICC